MAKEIVILTFSLKHLYDEAFNPVKWRELTITLFFYKGQPFTHFSKEGESLPFYDSKEVYKGDIDENEITTEERNMYRVWWQTAHKLDEQKFSIKDNDEEDDSVSSKNLEHPYNMEDTIPSY